jgi:hypothetical protein
VKRSVLMGGKGRNVCVNECIDACKGEEPIYKE